MQALSAAKTLDWRGWFLGLVAAAISGGAGAVGSGFGSIILDPKDFNLFQGGAAHLFALMCITFVFSAVLKLMQYLHDHPVPKEESKKEPNETS